MYHSKYTDTDTGHSHKLYLCLYFHGITILEGGFMKPRNPFGYSPEQTDACVIKKKVKFVERSELSLALGTEAPCLVAFCYGKNHI